MLRLFTFLLALSITPIPDAPKKVEWINDYGNALEACKINVEPLLVVIDRNPPIISDSYFDGYTCCFIDEDTKYGEKVIDAFRVEKLPFAAIIDNTGSIVLSKNNGEMSEKKWGNFLDRCRNGTREKLFNIGGNYVYKIPYYCPHCQRNIVE